MPSAIDPTKPISGNPTTASVRDNFAAAKNEIETLQATNASLTTAVNTLLNQPPYFSNEAVEVQRATVQPFAAATPAAALFPQLNHGTTNSLDGASSQLRAPTAGFYLCEWVILPRGDSATATVTPTLQINATDVHAYATISATTTFAIPQYFRYMARLNAGDVIGLKLSFSVAGGLKSRTGTSWRDDNRAAFVRISTT